MVAASLALAAVPSTARAAGWLRPVPGEPARPFSYSRAEPFAAGAHRGADLAAAAGTPVRAACAGRVLHAGAVARLGGVVSMRCGARRVSYLPLARPAVVAGAVVAAGTVLGVVAGGHGGLHVGVRRERDRFGYEDPLALLEPPRAAPRPPLPRARRRRAPPPRPQPPPLLPAAAPTGVPVAATRGGAPAPLPAWAGLALALPALAGSGRLALRRRAGRRPARARAAPHDARDHGAAAAPPGAAAPAAATASLRRARWPSTSRRPSTT
jgi:hypothetical protein